jgi:hypothetical protein
MLLRVIYWVLNMTAIDCHVLALDTLCDATPIGLTLFLSHHLM